MERELIIFVGQTVICGTDRSDVCGTDRFGIFWALVGSVIYFGK